MTAAVAPTDRKPCRWATYAGDCRDNLGLVVGPNTFGELLHGRDRGLRPRDGQDAGRVRVRPVTALRSCSGRGAVAGPEPNPEVANAALALQDGVPDRPREVDMTSITESVDAVIAASRTPRYRSRFTPVTEPWQRATDRIGYQPRHAVPTRASHCSCGRPAREVLPGGPFGPTGFCGAPFPPLDPCDCGEGAERHSRNVCHVYGRGMAETVVAR